MFTAMLRYAEGPAVEVPVVLVRGDGPPREGSVDVEGPSLAHELLENLPFLLHDLSPEVDVPDGLGRLVAAEGLASEVLTGTSPETWSPLGGLDVAQLAGWKADDGRDVPDLSADDRDGLAPPVVRMDFGNGQVSALAVSPDSLVVAIPGEVDEVELLVDPSWLEAFATEVDPRLHSAAPRGEIDELVLWRVYTGEGTSVHDVLTAAHDAMRAVRERGHRLRLGTRGRASVVVARLVRVAADHQSTQADPTRAKRLQVEEAAHPAVAQSCPDLDAETERVPRAVVVVHGAAAAGLKLAAAMQSVCTGSAGSQPPSTASQAPVRRYEHDTFLPIGDNARDLAHLLSLRVTDSVLLVGHSRGGVVAARAAQLLRAEGSGPRTTLVILGTPFAGTPFADVAVAGFLGYRALMGGLRLAGGPVVDAATRLAGLGIKGDTPPGLTELKPSSDYLALIREGLDPGTLAIAGDADPAKSHVYGLSDGFSDELFAGMSHDLVVSTESARGRLGGALTVGCDHFGYLVDTDVLVALDGLVRRWDGGGPSDADLEDWMRGLLSTD